MMLTQPAVGSTGWGAGVNLNFQTLQQFCNSLPNGNSGRVPCGRVAGAAVFDPVAMAFGSGGLAAGDLDTGVSNSDAVVFAFYEAPKSDVAPQLICWYTGGTWHVANFDAADSSSSVCWVVLYVAS
jgi:hypothetical protein